MELSIKSFILFGAIILTGLSAGLFYAWSVSVIPGTEKLTSRIYLDTMQNINNAILNPAFFLIFFGSVVFLSISSIYQLHTKSITFWLMLAATIFYLLGTVGVTALGNVPLNDQLKILKLTDLSTDKLEAFRTFYETKWNRLHLIRTIFAVFSFVLVVLALFFQTKKL
jgi:uncharacterized membrane protein